MIVHGDTQALIMWIISKMINFSFCLLVLFAAFYASSAVADDIVLPSTQGSHVLIGIRKQHVNAKNKKKT